MARLVRPLPILLLAALAACGAPAPENEAAPPAGMEAPIEEAGAPAPAAPALPAIPERFRGRWNVSAEACLAGSGDGGLEVAGDSLRFHESVARVESVRQVAPNAVEVRLALQGEGQAWRETRTLRLLPGGRLAVEGPGGTATRMRCRAVAAAPSMDWHAAAGAEGAVLSLGTGDARRLTFFCPPGTDDLLVNVPAFRPVGSEERMTFGGGGTVVTLVADLAGDAGRGGVSGTGPVPPELETILAGPEPLGVNYGAQDAGPHPVPPASLARTFLEGCRD